MARKNNFKDICEATIVRYQSSGFLQGDQVRFRKNAANNPWLKEKGEPFVNLIKSLMGDDVILKIAAVKGSKPTNSTIMDGSDSPTCHFADIVQEISPANWCNPVTVPVEMIEVVEPDGCNLPKYSKKLVRPTVPEKPADAVQKLGDKNVKLPFTKPVFDGAPKFKESVSLEDTYGNLIEKHIEIKEPVIKEEVKKDVNVLDYMKG